MRIIPNIYCSWSVCWTDTVTGVCLCVCVCVCAPEHMRMLLCAWVSCRWISDVILRSHQPCFWHRVSHGTCGLLTGFRCLASRPQGWNLPLSTFSGLGLQMFATMPTSFLLHSASSPQLPLVLVYDPEGNGHYLQIKMKKWPQRG